MSGEFPSELTGDDVVYLVDEAYVPFADINRAISWPSQDRQENDAEHSFSLALIGAALGEEIGLDPALITLFATVHDMVELYADDTSVWDDQGQLTKAEREIEALIRIKERFARTPGLANAIEDYESMYTEEARFVYALDKLLALAVIMRSGGHFWKENNMTFEMHLNKADSQLEKVAAHPVVLRWYEEVLAMAAARKDELFAPSTEVVEA